jgi:aldose 1-epimerase
MLLLMLPLVSEAANYSAVRAQLDGIEVIRLADAARKVEVTIVPSIGNIAYEMLVNGTNVFWSPARTLGEFKSKPGLAGNPFLAPFANRLDQPAFYANGKKYTLNLELGNIRTDGNGNPIHGLLAFSPLWEVKTLEAGAGSASVTSRLEYSRHPALMAQFPFAHTIEMTYRLQDGALECETALFNHASEPMPVAIGYHPYFRLSDAPRDDWKVHLAAKDHLVLSPQLIPTGERKPVAFANPVSLAGTQLDDVFSNLVRGAGGRAEISVQGRAQRLTDE